MRLDLSAPCAFMLVYRGPRWPYGRQAVVVVQSYLEAICGGDGGVVTRTKEGVSAHSDGALSSRVTPFLTSESSPATGKWRSRDPPLPLSLRHAQRSRVTAVSDDEGASALWD